jgi:hypothetical protein
MKWSRGNGLYLGYLLIALTPALVVCMGATISGLVGRAPCEVLPPWIDGAVYILFFFYACGVFTLLFIVTFAEAMCCKGAPERG